MCEHYLSLVSTWGGESLGEMVNAWYILSTARRFLMVLAGHIPTRNGWQFQVSHMLSNICHAPGHVWPSVLIFNPLVPGDLETQQFQNALTLRWQHEGCWEVCEPKKARFAGLHTLFQASRGFWAPAATAKQSSSTQVRGMPSCREAESEHQLYANSFWTNWGFLESEEGCQLTMGLA